MEELRQGGAWHQHGGFLSQVFGEISACTLKRTTTFIKRVPATFHHAVGEHVAEDPRQVFFSIPAQMAKNETQGVGKLGVAFDADVTHGSLEPVDQQLRQIGRVQPQQYLRLVLTDPGCEMAIRCDGKVDLGHRADREPRRASRMGLEPGPGPARL